MCFTLGEDEIIGERVASSWEACRLNVLVVLDVAAQFEKANVIHDRDSSVVFRMLDDFGDSRTLLQWNRFRIRIIRVFKVTAEAQVFVFEVPLKSLIINFNIVINIVL